MKTESSAATGVATAVAGGVVSVGAVAALVETENSAAMGVATAGAGEAGGVVSVGTVAVLAKTESSAAMGVATAVAGGVVSVGTVAVQVTTNGSAAISMSRAENCTTLSPAPGLESEGISLESETALFVADGCITLFAVTEQAEGDDSAYSAAMPARAGG